VISIKTMVNRVSASNGDDVEDTVKVGDDDNAKFDISFTSAKMFYKEHRNVRIALTRGRDFIAIVHYYASEMRLNVETNYECFRKRRRNRCKGIPQTNDADKYPYYRSHDLKYILSRSFRYRQSN
jgi:hypothetical protein